jgi:hypothetical protein
MVCCVLVECGRTEVCGMVDCGCAEGCMNACMGVFAACACGPTPAASPPRAFPGTRGNTKTLQNRRLPFAFGAVKSFPRTPRVARLMTSGGNNRRSVFLQSCEHVRARGARLATLGSWD